MSYLGIFRVDDYVGIPAATHRFSSGAAYAPTVLTYSIYEEATAVGLDEDVDMTPASPFDSVVGCYWVRRQLTAAAGFEAGKNYLVVVKATVDSVAAIQMHTFQVEAVNVAQTGDAYARLGAPAGASVSADVAAVKAQTAAIEADTQDLQTQVGTAGAGLTALGDTRLANLDATISSRSVYAGGAVASVTGAVGSVTGGVTVTTNNDKIGYTVSTVSDKTGYSLAATYDAAKTAATQTSVDDLPTNAELATALGDIPTAIENADALLTRDWTAVTGEAARSVLNALRFLRNKWSISGTTLTVTKEDDSTTAWTGALTASASADPITALDPS